MLNAMIKKKRYGRLVRFKASWPDVVDDNRLANVDVHGVEKLRSFIDRSWKRFDYAREALTESIRLSTA